MSWLVETKVKLGLETNITSLPVPKGNKLDLEKFVTSQAVKKNVTKLDRGKLLLHHIQLKKFTS